MTITVGASEAKTHLSTRLDREGEGEEVIITKHGKPVARLVSAAGADRNRARSFPASP
jgi:prevent-host-death family protein